MGFRQPFSSLTSYSVQVTVNLTIAALILIGGLGFLTWDDIKEHKLRLRKYRAQSKMILATTAVLVILPFFYFWFCEYGEMGERNGFRLAVSGGDAEDRRI